MLISILKSVLGIHKQLNTNYVTKKMCYHKIPSMCKHVTQKFALQI